MASRRQAEEMILQGRVTVNGALVEDLGQKADPDKDHIKVDGKLVKAAEPETLYYIFNKPRNVVSTLSDPEERPCLGDFLKNLKKRLFTVGRLDFDAEGLMILTNDGDLVQKMSHPKHAIARTYLVKVKGSPDIRTLSKIRPGLQIGDGEKVGKVAWTVIRTQKTSTWIKVVLYEGKKNEIKRIFQRINHPVRKLRRVQFGPFALGKLAVGEIREFTAAEAAKVEALKKGK